MSQVIVSRWGRNLAIRLPLEVVRVAGIHDGERLDIEVSENEILIRRAPSPSTLEELFKGRTSEEWRSAYADAFDWGPDRGREVVE